jgi:hypothetical protein
MQERNHLRHGIISGMASSPAWHHLRHGIISGMATPVEDCSDPRPVGEMQ